VQRQSEVDDIVGWWRWWLVGVPHLVCKTTHAGNGWLSSRIATIVRIPICSPCPAAIVEAGHHPQVGGAVGNHCAALPS